MKYGLLNFFVLFLLLAGCEKNKTPLSVETPNYTSHDFEWTADTLAPPDAFQVFMYDIWGTDENNVWCVGHSDLSAYQVWHWDGESWKNVKPDITGERPSYSEIFGFAENDFWIVGTAGYQGYVLHYDGSWERIDNNDLQHCYSIWGTSSQNLFIGSRHGLIYQYNGEHFIPYETGRNILITTIWGLKSGEIFAIGVNNENQPVEPPIRYLYKYAQDKFLLVDSLIVTSPGDQTIGMDLWGTDMNNLYSPTGDGLTKYVNGAWVTQFYATLYRIFGSSSHNIFTGGYSDKVYHFNGIDWAEVYSGNEVIGGIWGMWCTENYVFVIQHPEYFTRILKGKIK